jgi:hypothetical protein
MLADFVPSLIRTYVPLGVGFVLTFLAQALGIVISDDTSALVTAFVAVVVSGVYYAAVRLLEARWPAIGRVLLALGVTAKQPTYVPQVPPPT